MVRTLWKRWLRWIVLLALWLLAGASLAAGGYLVYRIWPRPLPPPQSLPRLSWSLDTQRGGVLKLPGQELIAVLGTYGDELYAYLMFDFLRSRREFRGQELLLISKEQQGTRRYDILWRCPFDILTCLPELHYHQSKRLIQFPAWGYLNSAVIAQYQRQTQVFAQAYNGPVESRFRELSRSQRILHLRRFIRFKSATDPRVLGATEQGPRPLTKDQAFELAADIIAVAEFYDLPLEFFLGIGAMENNYMNVQGDLEHVVWKRRKGPGDIIVRRGRRGILVRNPSAGVWQITRETLRHAHTLFLKDKRDYSALPPRLRPDRVLDVDNVPQPVLTTYAGLLLSSLLDYFHGDIGKAVGAYNGGPGNPNARYEEGVEHVASYARRILERAAAMNRSAVDEAAPTTSHSSGEL